MVVLLAACGQAGADSAAAVKLPEGWTALADMAALAKQALADDQATVEAWGDQANGCYAVRIDNAGEGMAHAIAERIVEGLGGVVLKDVRIPDEGSGSAAKLPGLLTVSFERAAGAAGSGVHGPASAYRGKLKAKVGGGRVVVLACFANERDPATCETACTTMLGAFQ
jgi:hypothetical protein